MRIDHVGIEVKDYDASKEFYELALAPLGMTLMMEPAPGVGGFGGDARSSWTRTATTSRRSATSRAERPLQGVPA